jgi:hypothetical protein
MGVSKEELARMVMRQALKDPRLFKELSKRGFELEKVPEAYVAYLFQRGDPVMMELYERTRYTLAVARYLDYLLRNGLPLRRKHLEIIAAKLARIGERPEWGRGCLQLYVNGWAKGEGLPFKARMDMIPRHATKVYLYYCESPACARELPVVD